MFNLIDDGEGPAQTLIKLSHSKLRLESMCIYVSTLRSFQQSLFKVTSDMGELVLSRNLFTYADLHVNNMKWESVFLTPQTEM